MPRPEEGVRLIQAVEIVTGAVTLLATIPDYYKGFEVTHAYVVNDAAVPVLFSLWFVEDVAAVLNKNATILLQTIGVNETLVIDEMIGQVGNAGHVIYGNANSSLVYVSVFGTGYPLGYP